MAPKCNPLKFHIIPTYSPLIFSRDGLTALHCAASRGHTGCIDTLIGLCGAPTDLIDSNGCTALHYAVTLGHADATSLLLAKEADPNRQDRKGRTPAHCGCAKGQFETVKILHSRKANLWLRNARGDLPVHEAATSGRRELVQWLLEQRPKQVNTTSNDGRSLLHNAAQNDNTDMCKMLIDYGADVNSIYRTMRNVVLTPLDCALQKGHRSTAKFLQLHGGLPAGKLRLSGRNNVAAVNDQELVKPLKFDESKAPSTRESSGGSGKTGEYVVYVKRSDSESSGDSEGRSSRKKKEVPCSHHNNSQRSKEHCHRRDKKRSKSKERRRTSSCSDTFLVEKDQDGDSDERRHGMNRCKSNMEIRRRNKSKETCCPGSRSSSCSTETESESSAEEDCCKHRRHKKKHNKTCRRYKVSVRKEKKSSKSPARSESEKRNKSQERQRQQEPSRVVEMCDKDTQSMDIPYESIDQTMDGPRNEPGSNNKSPSRPPSTSSISSVKKRPQSARVSSAKRQQQNAQLEAVDFDNDLAQIEKEFVPQKVVSLTEILDNEPESELLSLVNENDGRGQDEDNKLMAEKGSAEGNPQGADVNDDDGKGASKNATPGVTVAGDEEDGAESDVTFTMEQPAKEKDKSQQSSSPQKQLKPSTPATVTFSSEITAAQDDEGSEVKEQIPGNEIGDQQQEKSPEDAQATDEVKIQQDASQKENTNKPQTPVDSQPSPLLPAAPPATPDTRHQKLQRQSSQGSSKSAASRRGGGGGKTTPASFAVLSNAENLPEALDQTSPIRSSLKATTTTTTTMSSMDNNVKSVSISDSRPGTSFKVLTDNRSGQTAPADHQSISTDDEQPLSAATVIAAGGEEDRSRMKRLKKRTKSRDSLERNQPERANNSDRSSPAVIPLSRDPDSGFEPSPRASKSKIPRAINHDQDELDGRSSRRDGFIILDDNKVKGARTASEGRKPGDKNACNMAAVNASIQKNIRR